jgi:hypothetical protein
MPAASEYLQSYYEHPKSVRRGHQASRRLTIGMSGARQPPLGYESPLWLEGIDRTVFTYRLIVRNSVEEKIVQLQERKRQLFDAVIGTDGAALKSLSEADVDDILG